MKKRVFVDMDNVLVDFQSDLTIKVSRPCSNTPAVWMKYQGCLVR